MDPNSIVFQIFSSISQLSGPAAYCTIVGILFICGLGIPIPEDITLLTAGLLASGGRVSLVGALLAGFVGVMLGDALLFFMGRRYGKKIFALPGFRRVFTPERVLMAESRIRKHGPFICFIARFLPGLRSPIFAMAGALGVRPITFFALDGFAAMLSVPLWVYAGFWLGNSVDFAGAFEEAKSMQLYVLVAIATVILVYAAFKLIKRRRARLTISVAPSVADFKKRE